MTIKQISIFVENREGRLAEITEILAANDLNIRALSIADTADFGIFRLIVSDPDKALTILKKEGLTVSATEVLGVGIPDQPGGFSKAMRTLADAKISIEYVYAFLTPEAGTAYIIIRVENKETASTVLTQAGFKIITQEEIFNK